MPSPPSMRRWGCAVGEVTKSATLSPCGLYRYRLGRFWDNTKRRVAFVMLNPSTADASEDDPTIRRCMGFAKQWGAGGIEVVNLFAFRSTDPHLLWTQPDPVGPDNNHHVRMVVSGVSRVVVAWGAGAKGGEVRVGEVMELLIGVNAQPLCLGRTKDGFPRHPLYVKAAQQPEPFLPACRSQRDGDCIWKSCPQHRDSEPATSGRHCPLDWYDERDGYQ